MKKWSLLLSFLIAPVLLLGSSEVPHAKATSPLSVIPDKMVTLTFDDGPDPRFTPAILQLLKQHHLHATFFIMGKNALAHPELVQEIERDGNQIANHTLTHPHLEKMNHAQVRAELEGGDAAMTAVLGPQAQVPHFFRPPRGMVSQTITDTVSDMGKELVLWNVCVENHTTTTPEQVRERVAKEIDKRDGGILLAHDGELDRSLTIQSLPLILDDLEQKQYRIVSLDTYLASRNAKSRQEKRGEPFIRR